MLSYISATLSEGQWGITAGSTWNFIFLGRIHTPENNLTHHPKSFRAAALVGEKNSTPFLSLQQGGDALKTPNEQIC